MENRLPKSFSLLASLLCVTVLVYWMYVLKDILILISFSVLFSMLLFPLCRRLEHWRFPRLLAISVCLLVSAVVVVGVLFLISLQIGEFTEAYPIFQQKIEVWGKSFQVWANKNLHISRAKALNELKKASGDLLKNAGGIVTNALGTTTSTLTSAGLIPIFVFFFLYYRDFFRNFFHKVFRSVPKSKVNVILHKIYEVVQGYLAGMLLVILIVGTLNTIGLLFLGIDYAPFFGFLAAFLLLIPYIGISVGALLPVFWALITKDSPVYALGVGIVFGVVQVLESNFITPQVVGSKVSINPLAAMIALILGGQIWGISGLILALPFTAILKVIFDSSDSLKPYGYVLGEAEHRIANTRRRRNRIVEE
jgi:predicted PurR-regulated permease PerM